MFGTRKAAIPESSIQLPRPPASFSDDQRRAAESFVRKMEKRGLGDLVADERAMMTRTAELRAEFALVRAGVSDDAKALAVRVANGAVSAADALPLLAELTAIEAQTRSVHGSRFGHLEHAAIEHRRTQVALSIWGKAFDLHAALQSEADGIVTAIVGTATDAIELTKYAKAIERAATVAARTPSSFNRSPQDLNVPVSPLRDQDTASIVASRNLRALTAELQGLHEDVEILRLIAPAVASVPFRTPGAQEVDTYLRIWTPSELQLAVKHELGWQPGLWLASEASPAPSLHGRAARRQTTRALDDLRPDFDDALGRDMVATAVANVSPMQSL